MLTPTMVEATSIAVSAKAAWQDGAGFVLREGMSVRGASFLLFPGMGAVLRPLRFIGWRPESHDFVPAWSIQAQVRRLEYTAPFKCFRTSIVVGVVGRQLESRACSLFFRFS